MDSAAVITIIVGVLMAAFGGWVSIQNKSESKAHDLLRESERNAQKERDTALKETLQELKIAVIKQTESYEKLSRSLDRIDTTVSALSKTFERIEKESEHRFQNIDQRFQDVYHWIYHLLDQTEGLRDSRHNMGNWFGAIRLIFKSLEKENPVFKIEERWELPDMRPLRKKKEETK